MLKTHAQKISTRLLASYAIPLICFGILGFSGYRCAQKTEMLGIERNWLIDSSDASHQAAYQLIDSIRVVKGNVLHPDESKFIGLYNEKHSLFLQDIETLKALSKKRQDFSQQQLAERLEKEGLRIDNIIKQIFSELKQKDVETATQLTKLLESDRVAQDREVILTYLNEQIDANAIAQTLAQDQLTQILSWGVKLAALATIGLGGLLTYQIHRQMIKLVGIVEKNGIQVTTSSTQIAASSRQLEASVTEQVASTAEITATASEIAATAEVLSQTIERVSGLSEAAATTASAGKADLERMASTIEHLIAATATISAKLGQIDNKANNISAVVTAITKVADQTNLLSLNAAIEAEKAGDSGAGFSVVAREIRRLADQTAIATLDIENMVQEMLSSVSAGVMEMDKFTQDVGENAESITQISQQMAQIIYQVQSLVPQFETVSDGMLAQAQGAQQIKAAMEQLNDASQQTADSVKEANQVISQLSHVAHDLQSEVAHFRLAV